VVFVVCLLCGCSFCFCVYFVVGPGFFFLNLVVNF